MSLPSANQVRHLFVFNGAKKDSLDALKTSGKEGDYYLAQNDRYIKYYGINNGELVSTDDINTDNTNSYNSKIITMDTKASSVLNTYTLKNTVINGITEGATVVLTVQVLNAIGSGVQDQIFRQAVVKASGDTTTKALLDDLAYANKDELFGLDIDNEVISDASNYWERGKFFVGVTPVRLTLYYIDKEGAKHAVEDFYTKGTKSANDAVKKLADLEVYCAAEKGSNYNGMGYPYVSAPKYLVDLSKHYEVTNYHSSFIGSNESVQKSERDITVAIAVNN